VRVSVPLTIALLCALQGDRPELARCDVLVGIVCEADSRLREVEQDGHRVGSRAT
jgi:hypothetical protein